MHFRPIPRIRYHYNQISEGCDITETSLSALVTCTLYPRKMQHFWFQMVSKTIIIDLFCFKRDLYDVILLLNGYMKYITRSTFLPQSHIKKNRVKEKTGDRPDIIKNIIYVRIQTFNKICQSYLLHFLHFVKIFFSIRGSEVNPNPD